LAKSDEHRASLSMLLMYLINILHFYLYFPFDIFAIAEEQVAVLWRSGSSQWAQHGVRDALQM
jgi:hypothetical protein